MVQTGGALIRLLVGDGSDWTNWLKCKPGREFVKTVLD